MKTLACIGEHVAGWTEKMPPGPRRVVEGAVLAVLGPALRRAERRARLDLTVRALGEPGARWYEPTAFLWLRAEMAKR
jgi:hypothetical protein